jgi:hypothetical protein
MPPTALRWNREVTPVHGILRSQKGHAEERRGILQRHAGVINFNL